MGIEWKFSNAAPVGVDNQPGTHPVIIENIEMDYPSDAEIIVTVRFIETDVRTHDAARAGLAQLLEGYRRTRGVSRVVTRETVRVALEVTSEQRKEIRSWLDTLVVHADASVDGVTSRLITEHGDVVPEAVFTLLRAVAG